MLIFFSHVVLYAAPVVPALFLIRATHATLCVVCRGIGVLPQIDLVRLRERERHSTGKQEREPFGSGTHFATTSCQLSKPENGAAVRLARSSYFVPSGMC